MSAQMKQGKIPKNSHCLRNALLHYAPINTDEFSAKIFFVIQTLVRNEFLKINISEKRNRYAVYW